MSDAKAAMAVTARREGIVGSGASIIVDGAELAADELAALSVRLRELLALLCDLPERHAPRGRGPLALSLGHRTDELPLITADAAPLDPNALFRVDLVHSGGRWRVLEVNADSTVGGLTYAALPRLTGARRCQDALSRWADAVAKRCAERGRGAIIEDEACVAAMRPTLERMAAELEQRLRVPVPVIGHRAARAVGTELHGPHGALGWIYRLFCLDDIRRDPTGYAGLREALTTGRIAAPFGFEYRVAGNKAALAKAWQLRDDGQLSASEARAVEELVPRTKLVTRSAMDELVARRGELVLKPAEGYGGIDVVIGREHAASAWKAKLVELVEPGAPRFVVQDYVQPQKRPVVISRPDGQLLSGLAHPVWGVFVTEGEATGAILRASLADGAAVVNVRAGAAAGPVEVVA